MWQHQDFHTPKKTQVANEGNSEGARKGWLVRHNFAASQPAWTADKSKKFGPNNEGFVVHAGNEDELKQKLKSEHNLNPAYLKWEEHKDATSQREELEKPKTGDLLPSQQGRVRANPVERYHEAGMKAGEAARRRDYSTSRFHSEWARRAISSEHPDNQKESQDAFDKAYRDSSGFNDKPHYF